jgi:head-tail adaptor
VIDPGRLTHSVSIQTPGAPVADGEGGYTQTWYAITPSPVWCSFTSAAARDMQRLAGGNATLAAATHIIEMHYHSGITTRMRVVIGTRPLNILGVANVDEADEMTRLFCEEVLSEEPVPVESSWVQEGGWYTAQAPVTLQPSWIQEDLT